MMHNERGQHPRSKTEMGNASNNGSDAEIDALLKDFFKHEMPADLQQDASAPQLVTVSRGTVVGDPHNGGWLGISVVVASLVTIVLLLERPVTNLYDGTAGPSTLNSSTTGLAGGEPVVPASAAKADVEISVNKVDNDVDQFNAVKGPVELNNKIRIKNVTVPDPETGTEVELFPELEIEIFPIDDEKPAGDKKSNDESGDE